jgi:archaellum component FlaC
MSDHRIVTFDSAQFAKLEKLVGDITTTLENKLAHIERTLKPGLDALAQGGKTGDNSEVLNAINNLNRKVDEFMATQEERLQGIQTALTGVADGVNTLQQQIADLKAANPALEDEISAIESTVKGIADDINGVTTEPPAQG